MIFIRKKLIKLIIILIPIAVISFNFKTNYFFNDEIYIRVYLQNKNKIVTVPLSEYVIGVVGGEMPANFNEEALKAQTVLARTYALYKKKNTKKNYDVINTTNDQAYKTKEELVKKWGKDYQKYYQKLKNIENITKNEIIMYNGKLIKPYYYAFSNGYTESAMMAFNENTECYKVKKTSFDNSSIKNFTKIITMSLTEFKKRLNITTKNVKINTVVRSDSDRVKYITINNKNYTGIQIRKLLNLRSADFTINITKNEAIITTKGNGHGVGMSQYGANYLAKTGKNYEEIIQFYFENITLTTLNDV